jgi:hypothetical protein
VPLYREAGVVDGLLAALAALRYPRDRFQALILLEADDAETATAFASRTLPAGVAVVTVPPGTPRTKPRACNVGLEHVTGELVVVYDAEDRPNPDQLLRAAAAFRRLPAHVVCLQAQLNVYNRHESLSTRGFAIEYSTWFDLILPGLHAVGAPIPLGGTSNHFRAEALLRLGWDPWNVTEDCELGLRLARAGLETAILDSTTWEEAPIGWGMWIRQRSRWMKGYWQTFIAHTRNPLACWRELGAWRSAWMVIVVFGQVLALLAVPLALLLAAAWLWWRWPLFDPHRPWTVVGVVLAVAMALGNVFYILIHAIAAWQRGFRSLVCWAPLMPFYWLLASLATWRGVWQAFRDPFTWEKTTHGVSSGSAPTPAATTAAGVITTLPSATATVPVVASRRPLLAVLLVGFLGLTAWASSSMPHWLRLDEEIAYVAIRMDNSLGSVEAEIDADWTGASSFLATITLAGVPAGATPLRAIVHLKTIDGSWFQREVRLRLVDGRADLAVQLDEGWTCNDSRLPWSTDQLRRVRAVGLQVFASTTTTGVVSLSNIRSGGQATTPVLAATDVVLPPTVRQQAMAEIRFRLSRSYSNPFSAADIDLVGEFTAPDGSVQRIPAFYTQDFSRRSDQGREVLEPVGLPNWAVRWRPTVPGAHRFRLVGHDRNGDHLEVPSRDMIVTPSDLPGAVRTSGQHFEREDGSFYYPVGINLRSPHDTLVESMPGVRQPDDAEGTFVYDRWFASMAANDMDFARLWLAPGFLALEWNRNWPGYHGQGIYNLQNAWRLDYLLAAARSKGILLELALWQHGLFTVKYDSQWIDNPYNSHNGGPLTDPTTVMNNPEVRAGFHDLLRYIAARYGADSNLFGYTMWIECDSVAKTGLVDWHADMAAYLKTVDHNRHPISAEFFTATGEADVWALPGIDYTQLAGYIEGDQIHTFLARATTLQPFGKPALIEEYGGTPDAGGVRWTAHLIHDGLWTGWFMRIAGAPLAWFWPLVFDQGLERHYRRFAAFISGADLRGTAWKHRFLTVTGDPTMQVLVRSSSERAWLWIHATSPGSLKSVSDYWPRHRGQVRNPTHVTGFDPLAAEPGRLFPDRPNRSLRLDQIGLAPGHYQLEIWDTWTDATPVISEVVVGPEAQPWVLPPLTRDTAIRIVPQR